MSDTVLTFRDFYMRLFAAGDADAVRLKPYAKRLRATHEPIEKNIAKAIGSYELMPHESRVLFDALDRLVFRYETERDSML